MKDVNSVVMVGRLTRDAELKYSQGGLPILKFAIAVNRSKKTSDGSYKDEASFFDVARIGAGAEGIAPYLTKGTRVVVQGELRQDRWEKDGQTRSRVEIDAYMVQLVGTKPQDGPAGGAPEPRDTVQRDPEGQAYDSNEEIPF